MNVNVNNAMIRVFNMFRDGTLSWGTTKVKSKNEELH